MTSKVPQVVLDDLRDTYLDMKQKRSGIAATVRERFRKTIQEEIERETRLVERAFAVQLVEVREMGASRKELVNVIGDGTASVMRDLIELGGGSVRSTQTGEERKAQRAEDMGVRRVSDELFDLVVATNEDGSELAIPVKIIWADGKPMMWPEDSSEVITLRDTYGYTKQDMLAKGAEIASAFGLEED